MGRQKEKSTIFADKAKGKTLGNFLQFVGYMMICIYGCMSIALVLRSVFRSTGLTSDIYMCFAAVLAGCVFVFAGRQKKSFTRRYRYYRNLLEGKETISIEELSALTGKKSRLLLKDLRKLIGEGTLLQGHLDEEETHLFLTNQSYEQYVRLGRTKTAVIEAVKEPQKEQTLKERTLKELGEEYLLVFENCSKKIASKEVLKLIADIGVYSVQILSAHENEDQKEKFLRYYFPATEKLLFDYRELEKEGMEADCQDLIDMLGTIRYSFETFSKNLSEGKRTDVETDILALDMMLSKM